MSSVVVSGDTSGSVTISAPAVSGSSVLTLPAVTDTLVGKATTDTLTNKSIVATQLTGTVAAARLPAGSVIQVVHTATGAVATGTTLIPGDDTIPQITEGTEFMTLSITPTSATNRLFIQHVGNYSNQPINIVLTIALFVGTTADALACLYDEAPASSRVPRNYPVFYDMEAGTTSSLTFRVRAGGDMAGTTNFNGRNGSRMMGGAMASFLRITEYAI